MGLPENANLLSSIYDVAPYASQADQARWQPFIDLELGGVGIQDPSQGLEVQTWRAEYYNKKVYVTAPDGLGRKFLFERSGIREISLAFDSNMAPFIAYMVEVGGDVQYESWFYWFDPISAAFIHTKLPDYSRYPKCCLDDKRAFIQNGNRDVILAYMRGDTLYCREQKDRYSIEKFLWTGFRARLNKVGMNIHNRLQWQLQALPP